MSATIQPIKVQPRNIFNIRIAFLLLFLRLKAINVGIKYKAALTKNRNIMYKQVGKVLQKYQDCPNLSFFQHENYFM